MRQALTKEAAIRVFGQNRTELASMGVASLALFGSTARNEAGPQSDLDLVVEFARPVGLFDFVRLNDRLEAMVGARVDLTLRSTLQPALRPIIEGEAVLVF